MKAPWRCQVEQTPHREAYNGGGMVFKGRFYNQVVWKCTNFGEVQFPGIIVFFPIFLLSQTQGILTLPYFQKNPWD